MLALDVTLESAPPHGRFGGVDPADIAARAARAVLEDARLVDAELSIALLDDAAMAAMNLRWKGRDAATDVLAFALHDEGEPPLGDVYVGWERALRQAREMGESPARELARLTVHGTLHVLGWDHPEEGREGSEMWKHQERILGELGIP